MRTNDKLLSLVSDLIDDLHDNHDYFANWRDCNYALDHGAQHVHELLRMFRRRPEYAEWASDYLKTYDAAAEERSKEIDLLAGVTAL